MVSPLRFDDEQEVSRLSNRKQSADDVDFRRKKEKRKKWRLPQKIFRLNQGKSALICAHLHNTNYTNVREYWASIRAHSGHS
jgi:hypothetical protein